MSVICVCCLVRSSFQFYVVWRRNPCLRGHVKGTIVWYYCKSLVVFNQSIKALKHKSVSQSVQPTISFAARKLRGEAPLNEVLVSLLMSQ